MQVKIPNLGDGIDSATVLSVMVAVGDSVAIDQTIIELETDKAVAPVPSTESGTVQSIHVSEGDTVTMGQLVISLTSDGATSDGAAPSSKDLSPASNKPEPVSPKVTPVMPVNTLQHNQPPVSMPIISNSSSSVSTSPWIRKIANQIGLDLSLVPTQSGGRLTIDDLRYYVSGLQQSSLTVEPTDSVKEAPKAISVLPNFEKWGDVTRESLASLRIKIAEKMSDSWNQVPHVTQFDQADITAVMASRKTHNPMYKKKGVNLTLSAISIKVVVDALKKFPRFNSSFDINAKEIILKQYYHIGVAVDTPSGLIVPVIRDADKKSLFQLAKEIGELAEKARDRKLSVDELQGGTFTVSNLGGLGVGAFTPIVNTPEVAIIGLGRAQLTPVVKDGVIQEALIQPIAISYDHRIIDGADGARFTREIVSGFEHFSDDLIKEIN